MQLITERLFLIPLQPDGMRALLARTTDPELIQPYTDMLDLSLSHPEQWVWYTAWGLYQNDSGDWVGDLCFKGLPENGQPEIGYGLLPEYEHQGYATEALRAVLRFGFNTLRLNRIEAQHELDNPASGRVMEKCGMRKEGVLRQRLYNKGKFVDVALYAILKDDARPARRAPAR